MNTTDQAIQNILHQHFVDDDMKSIIRECECKTVEDLGKTLEENFEYYLDDTLGQAFSGTVQSIMTLVMESVDWTDLAESYENEIKEVNDPACIHCGHSPTDYTMQTDYDGDYVCKQCDPEKYGLDASPYDVVIFTVENVDLHRTVYVKLDENLIDVMAERGPVLASDAGWNYESWEIENE